MRKLKRYEFIIIITLLSLMMLLVSSFFISHKVYTSKVTWVENKGFPIRYLEYDGSYGPCGPEVEGRCKNISLQDINYYYFLANLLFFVAISRRRTWSDLWTWELGTRPGNGRATGKEGRAG